MATGEKCGNSSHVNACICVYMYIFIYVNMHIMCVHMYMYICICICRCICICIFACTHNWHWQRMPTAKKKSSLNHRSKNEDLSREHGDVFSHQGSNRAPACED